MKKLLFIFSGLSVTTLPIVSVVSCANTREIIYKSPKDIQKYWYKNLYNTISVWDIENDNGKTKSIKYKENIWREMQKVIAFQFDNQEDVKKDLEDNKSLKIDDITFYTSKNESTKLTDINEEIISKFKKEDNQKIYFKYTYENKTSNFLEINITNKPPFEQDYFKSAIFINDNFILNELEDNKYNLGTINLVKNHILWIPTSAENIFDKKYKTSVLDFIKTLLNNIELKDKSSLYNLISNKLSWEEFQRPNKTYKKYKNLTIEEQVYKYFESQENYKQDLIKLISNLKSSEQTGDLIFKSKNNTTTYNFKVVVEQQ